MTRCDEGQAIDWAAVVSDSQEPVYLEVMRAAEAAGVRFAVGGSLAVAAYAGRNKQSKDLDLYVLPEEKDRMIEIVTRVGLRDYFDELPYDRKWIYRATNGDCIVDVIWSMANQRTNVDEEWLTLGMPVTWEGLPFRMIPLEEMIWSKLYVLQRDRCDWPDILNLIDANRDRIDWARLVARVGDDAPLVSALLWVYHWLNPPPGVGLNPPPAVGLNPRPAGGLNPAPAGGPPHPASIAAIGSGEEADRELTRRRADLLDSRPWLLSVQEEGGNHRC